MGKKSLIKSTSKKRSTAKAKKKMPKSKDSKSPRTKTKTTLKSKGASHAKKESKKMAASKKNKNPILRELLSRKFEHETSQKIYTPPKENIDSKNFIAPPYINGKSQTETERIKKLLFNKYSMEAVELATPKNQTKTPQTAPSKGLSRQELIFKKFEVETPKKLFQVDQPQMESHEYLPASFLADKEKDEVERIRKILNRQFSIADLKAAAEKAAAEKAAAEKAAAEKAAAEKAAAEKAAAEKAAAEKAAAEKAAAEKAAAEKAAAEKAAAEKAAAEKAAAEKAAAEKAAAEKAAAEKAAAEKAAAEKAAAEKAAAEKAAAEKAATEKAATEKAAAEKAAAEKAAQPKATVTFEPSPSQPKKESDPVDRGIKILAAGIGLVFLLIMIASTSNSGKYYLKPNNGSLEIWKGNFAPMGKSLLVSMPDVPAPKDLKQTYRKKEVFPMVFAFYIDRADKLLETDNYPDFEGIEDNVSKALDFSITPEQKKQAMVRLNSIDQMILIYKADIAASRETIESLEKARDYLEEAGEIDGDQAAAKMIIAKQNKIAETLSSLKGEALAEKDDHETTGKKTAQPPVPKVPETAKKAVEGSEKSVAKNKTTDGSAHLKTKNEATEKGH